MTVNAISVFLLKSYAVAPMNQGQPLQFFSSTYAFEDHFFIAAMAFYLSQLHQLMMKSWQRFDEMQKEIAQTNASYHKARQLRHAQLESQRKHTENLFQDVGQATREGVYRQSNRLKIFEGENFKEHRHVHFAI